MRISPETINLGIPFSEILEPAWSFETEFERLSPSKKL